MYSGFVGNAPISFGPSGSSSSSSSGSNHRARTTPEKKFADILCRTMDSMSINVVHIVECAMQYPTAVQSHIFDLCVAFIGRYAYMHESGWSDDDRELSRVAIQSHAMMQGLEQSMAQTTGKHAAS